MKKYSRQREAILRALRATKSHPTASEIYEHVRRDIPNISLGTVYRNLSQLTASGQILKITTGEGTERFDGNCERHYHFCCHKCGGVIDFQLPQLESIETEVFSQTGNLASSHSLMLYGSCRGCREAAGEPPPV